MPSTRKKLVNGKPIDPKTPLNSTISEAPKQLPQPVVQRQINQTIRLGVDFSKLAALTSNKDNFPYSIKFYTVAT